MTVTVTDIPEYPIECPRISSRVPQPPLSYVFMCLAPSSFLPSVPGRVRHADLRIETPPVSGNVQKLPEMSSQSHGSAAALAATARRLPGVGASLRAPWCPRCALHSDARGRNDPPPCAGVRTPARTEGRSRSLGGGWKRSSSRLRGYIRETLCSEEKLRVYQNGVDATEEAL